MEAVLRKQNEDYFELLNLSKTANVDDFRFAPFKNGYLLSNDLCDFNYLNKNDFKQYLSGYDNITPFKCRTKEEKIEIYRNINSYNCLSTSLHIIVVGLNCPLKCVYCQVDAGVSRKNCILNKDTADKIIDFILNSPSKYIQIEFQGGEPLSNFDLIEYIVNRINELSNKFDKEISFVIVTSLFGMEKRKLEFIEKTGINISISIDGPEYIHNYNRPATSGNNFENLIYWLDKIKNTNIKFKSNFILTATKYSLKNYANIVDFYISIGADSIIFRPLSPFGRAKENWDVVGYTPEDFGEAYYKVLDLILNRNLTNKKIITELFASYISKKIFLKSVINHSEFRSPCGAGIGQIVYDWDGNIYPCDEARMVAVNGDKIFKLGNVGDSNYKACISNKIIEAFCGSSLLQTTPPCNSCVFLPLCGLCPVYNYNTYKSLHIKNELTDYNCNIKKQMFTAYFSLLFDENDHKREALKEWANV